MSGGLLAETSARYIITDDSSDHRRLVETDDVCGSIDEDAEPPLTTAEDKSERDSEDEKVKSENPSHDHSSVTTDNESTITTTGISSSSHGESTSIYNSSLTVTQSHSMDDTSDISGGEDTAPEHEPSVVGVGVDSVTPTGSDVTRDATLVHDISDAVMKDSSDNNKSVRHSDDEEHGETAAEPSSDEKTTLLGKSSTADDRRRRRIEEEEDQSDELSRLGTCSLLAGPSNPRTQRRLKLAQQNEPLSVTFDEKVIVRKIKAWDPCGPTFYSSEYGGRPSDSQSATVTAPSGSCCLIQ